MKTYFHDLHFDMSVFRKLRHLRVILLVVGLAVVAAVYLLTSHISNKSLLSYDVSTSHFKLLKTSVLAKDDIVQSAPTTLNLLEDELRDIMVLAEKEPTHEVISRTNLTCTELKIPYEIPKCSAADKHRCFQEHLPLHPRERLKSLLLNERLRSDPHYLKAIEEMGRAVPGHYNLIIVSAVSSNHYQESQTMLRNLHEDIFPVLNNFTLIVYDLGLTDEEFVEYQRYCRCKLIKFPFHLFPPHFTTLKCFGWKPIVIRAHYDNAKFVMWQDASIRFQRRNGLLQALQSAESYGVQQHRVIKFIRNPFRALPSIFHFFGDTPCAHLAFTQAESNWGIYRNSPLIKTAILDSWVACGLNDSCTCPVDQKLVQKCRGPGPNEGWTLGTCMRPQSAVAIILAKLFMEHYHVVVVTGEEFMSVSRGDKENYFKRLSRSK